MTTKTIIALLVVAGIGAGAYYVVSQELEKPPQGETQDRDTSPDTSAMRAEENMVVVMEQRPGTMVTGMVHLAAPGYLVIHEDRGGEPGAVLGASALLPAGDTDNINVTLSRPSKDGETLHAMLHFEKGGNTAFSATEDTPVPSALGGPISGWFTVSSDAAVDVPISI